MSSFEKAGVLFITGLVAVILALALFGTSGTTTPIAENPGAGGVAERGSDSDGGAGAGVEQGEITDAGEDIWNGPRDRVDELLGGKSRDGGAEGSPSDGLVRPSLANGREHVVRAGDRLANISREYLGDANLWKAIADANPGVDPSRLQVGRKLSIPERGAAIAGASLDSVRPKEAERRPVASEKKPTYVVKKGDTLTSIAQRELRDRAAWRKLFDMNKHVVKNANRLPVGLTLTLPAN
jgi:nucleoid-associated protein YgaU